MASAASRNACDLPGVWLRLEPAARGKGSSAADVGELCRHLGPRLVTQSRQRRPHPRWDPHVGSTLQSWGMALSAPLSFVPIKRASMQVCSPVWVCGRF